MFESYGYEKIRTSKKVVASHAVAHRSGREGRSLGSCGHRVCAPVVAVPPRQPPGESPSPGAARPLRVRGVEPGQRKRCRHVGRERARRRRGWVCVCGCVREWERPSGRLRVCLFPDRSWGPGSTRAVPTPGAAHRRRS